MIKIVTQHKCIASVLSFTPVVTLNLMSLDLDVITLTRWESTSMYNLVLHAITRAYCFRVHLHYKYGLVRWFTCKLFEYRTVSSLSNSIFLLPNIALYYSTKSCQYVRTCKTRMRHVPPPTIFLSRSQLTPGTRFCYRQVSLNICSPPGGVTTSNF
jgi:hypothetical protein